MYCSGQSRDINSYNQLFLLIAVVLFCVFENGVIVSECYFFENFIIYFSSESQYAIKGGRFFSTRRLLSG
jgi:hypothetical protein